MEPLVLLQVDIECLLVHEELLLEVDLDVPHNVFVQQDHLVGGDVATLDVL